MSVEFVELEPLLRDLFATQRYAILGTQRACDAVASPDATASPVSLNLMALSVTHDLRSLILVTERATLKYANLQAHPRVSLLVDNRGNRSDDTVSALVLSVDGLAEEVAGPEREPLALVFLTRHPQLASLVHSPTCALFRVKVRRYELVRGLYDVREVRLV